VRTFHANLLVTLLLIKPILAADLDCIDRTIAKEPPYHSQQPGYVLLVFGPLAQTRVWLVADDEFVYVDRNGNGDLTEPNDRVGIFDVRKNASPDAAYEEYRTYQLGDLLKEATWPRYTQLTLRQFRRPTASFGPDTPNAHDKATLTAHPNLAGNIRVLVNGQRQDAGPPFGRNAKDAPIIHFDGPLTIQVEDDLTQEPLLKRSGDHTDPYLRVSLGTPGLGKFAFAYWDYSIVPDNVHPVVEAQFPVGDPKYPTIMRTFALKERCCGNLFCGPVPIPDEAGEGKATLTISMPNWGPYDVKPIRFRVGVKCASSSQN